MLALHVLFVEDGPLIVIGSVAYYMLILGKYRSDCSGFVSAAWNYAPPGYTTSTMPANTLPSINSLLPCDAILKRSSHIALFYKKEGCTQPYRSSYFLVLWFIIIMRNCSLLPIVLLS